MLLVELVTTFEKHALNVSIQSLIFVFGFRRLEEFSDSSSYLVDGFTPAAAESCRAKAGVRSKGFEEGCSKS